MSEELDKFFKDMTLQRHEETVGKPSTRISNAPMNLPEPKPRMDPAAKGFLGAVNTAFDAATFGAARPVVGTANAIGDFLKNPYLSFDNISESYREGFEGADQFFDDQAAVLPIGLRFASELIGGGRGLPRKMDALIEKGLPLAPTRGQIAGKYGRTAGGAAISGGVDEYMRGNQDLGEALATGGLSSLMGVSSQYLIGDKLLPGIETRRISTDGVIDADKVGPIAYPASVLATNTRDQSGLSLNALYEFTKDGFDDPNMGILDLELGTTSKGEVARRFYNGLAELTFPGGIDPTKINSDPNLQNTIQLYDQTVGAVNRALEEANAAYASNVDSLLGDYELNFKRIKENGPNAQAAGDVLNSIKSTALRPDGTRPLGARILDEGELIEFLDDSEKGFAASLDLASLNDASEVERQVWRKYTDQFRVTEQEAIGLDWARKPIRRGRSGDPSTDLPDQQIGDFYSDISLARLYKGRAALAELVGPNAPSAEHNRVALKLMRVLDDKIDEMTAGQAGLARGEFAEAKRVEEAYDLGTKFFTARTANLENLDKYHNEFGTPLKEYIDGLSENAQDSFKEGWKRGLYEKFNRDGFAETMNYLIGPPNATGDRVRREGIEHMRLALGDETTDQLIKLHNEGRHLVDMRQALSDLYVFKNAAPGKRAQLIEEAIQMNTESDPGGMLTGMLADLQKIKRIAKPGDQERVQRMEQLLMLKGDQLAEVLNKSARSMIPLPRQEGVRSAALLTDLENFLSGEQIFSDELGLNTEEEGAGLVDPLEGLSDFIKSPAEP